MNKKNKMKKKSILCFMLLLCNVIIAQQQPLIPLSTYAEISIKKDGQWNGRKYENGHFENVDTLTVPNAHTDHSYFIRYEGPGWENKQIAYRLYLDWRNAIDIFGKLKDTLILKEIGLDGFESYHHPLPWGQDIFKVGKGLGIGGFGRTLNDSMYHFQQVEKTLVKTHNEMSHSSIIINYKNWQTEQVSVDLQTTLSIYPQDRFTKVEHQLSKEIKGFCTGIIKFDHISLMQAKSSHQKWAYIATYGNQTLVNDKDHLGLALFYKIEDVEMIKEGKYDHLVVFKPSTKSINYYFLAAWQKEKNGIKTRTEFENYINQLLQQLDAFSSL